MEQTREAKRLLVSSTVLRNRYRVESLIAQGGMGAIYQAVDQTFNSTVALKQMLASEASLAHAFAREALLLNSLRHTALPVVMDYFGDDHGQFLVMQYIPGEDLKQVLDRTGRSFPIADVMRWADQLLDALEYLHGHHPPILHRDIKPHNVKLSPRGDAILLDFGLAKGATLEATGATSSVYGYTPHYAPFEQILGRGTDPRSDLYALAATLHHLLTGAKPPDAMERADAIMNGHADPLRRATELNPAVPPAISEILYAAMALNANYRPPTAAAMRAALREPSQPSQGGTGTVFEVPIPWPPPGPPSTATGARPVRRTSGLMKLGLLALTFVALVSSVGWIATGVSYSELKRRSSSSDYSLNQRISTAEAKLKTEQDTRKQLADKWPVTVTSFRMRNEQADGTAIGDFGTRFPKSRIRYLRVRATLQNNYTGINELKGKIYVKFIDPDGVTEHPASDTSGYTLSKDVAVTDTLDVGLGWGNATTASFRPGPYRVELWWDNKIVGLSQIYVYDDETPSTP